LRGKRIGVMRFATGFGTEEAFEEALATLRARGAELVEIKEYGSDRSALGSNEFAVLLHEFKDGLNEYLGTTPAAVTTRTLADVIEFNRRNADREMPLFDQDIFEQAQATAGMRSDTYRKARETSLRLAGAEGIDRLLKQHNVVALVGPTRGAAWLIDTVHGDTSTGGGSGGTLAAVAGYPHLTVPMGAIRGLPIGLSFIGPKWSDALILSLGYAYEQASMKRIEPRLLPSIEQAPEVAPYLQPQVAARKSN
jgi:amidase